MDLVLPLGKGSLWQNNELKFTLRGIEKYLSGIDNLFIIGECPESFRDFIHIPCPDNTNACSENIYLKIMAACNDKRVSEYFIFFSDDHFLMKPFTAVEFPYYYNGTLEQLCLCYLPGASYRNTINNTIALLTQLGKQTINYNIHCPIIYNRELFINTFKDIRWKIPFGYVIKSIYCNMNGGILKPEVELPDLKLKKRYEYIELNTLLQSRPFFSIGDEALNEPLKWFLSDLYPIPSQWEK